MPHPVSLTAPVLACLLAGGPAFALESEESSLSDYFGFSSHDVIKIGDDPGPMLAADLNGDGLEDLLIVNNHDSRIDVLYQKKDPDRSDIQPPSRVNELPDHWRYRRESIPLADHARAFRTIDLDDDGDLDILYAGRNRVVVLEQDADIVMFLYRAQYYGFIEDEHGNSTEGKAELIVAKNRSGSLANIELDFIHNCTRFDDPNKITFASEGMRPNIEF